MHERRFRRLVEVFAAQQQLLITGLLDVLVPKIGRGRQGLQRHQDEERREVVQVPVEKRVLVAAGVLVGVDADFQVLPPFQQRHAHAVVIDELHPAGIGDHHIAVLEVAVGDLQRRQLANQLDPMVRKARNRLAMAVQALRAHVGIERFPFDPLHGDQRVPLAVPRRADPLLLVLERHQARHLPGSQVIGDRLVALAASARGG